MITLLQGLFLLNCNYKKNDLGHTKKICNEFKIKPSCSPISKPWFEAPKGKKIVNIVIMKSQAPWPSGVPQK